MACPCLSFAGFPRRSGRRIAILLAGIAAAACLYADTLRHPPVWDDSAYIFGQSYLRDCGNITQVLSPAIFKSVLPQYNCARPVFLASVLADTCLGRGAVFAYRLSNIYWYGLGVALVIYLGWLLSADLAVGVMAGLLFAAHPIHTEVVNIIAFRSDLLCLVFMLFSLILYRESGRRGGGARWGFVGAALLSFVLALLSKEMAVTLPLLVFLSDAVFPPSGGPAERLRLRVFLAAALVLIGLYLTFRAPRAGYVMPGHADVFSAWRENVDLPFSQALVEPQGPRPSVRRFAERPWHRVYEETGARVLTMSRIWGDYLRLLFWPYPLQNDYAPEVIGTWRSPGVWASWTAWAAVFAAVCLLWRRLPLASFGLLWLAVALLPVSGLVTLLNLKAERYLYVSSAGFCLAAAAALARLDALLPGRRIAQAVCALAVLAGGAWTVRRNHDYRSHLAFYEANRAADSRVPRIRLGLAGVYAEAGQDGAAEKELQDALRLWPDYVKARLFYARFLAEHGRLSESIVQLEAARAIAPFAPLPASGPGPQPAGVRQ